MARSVPVLASWHHERLHDVAEDGGEQRLVESPPPRRLCKAHDTGARGHAHELLPSILKTLTHIHLVDVYYLDALERGGLRYGIASVTLPVSQG